MTQIGYAARQLIDMKLNLWSCEWISDTSLMVWISIAWWIFLWWQGKAFSKKNWPVGFHKLKVKLMELDNDDPVNFFPFLKEAEQSNSCIYLFLMLKPYSLVKMISVHAKHGLHQEFDNLRKIWRMSTTTREFIVYHYVHD